MIFPLTDGDGVEVHGRVWLPDVPRAVVHVLHGWAEHSGRYARPADALVDAGYAAYADDHRGHGRTGEGAGGLGDLGPGGIDGALLSVRAVTERIRTEHPDLPLFLLGHSWGSFLAQRSVTRWGGDLTGAVLMGTTLRRPDGPRAGNLNERFEPARTPYEWLTRDPDEVDLYIADPWCSFERLGGRPDAAASTSAGRPVPEGDDTPPPDLPILIMNGSDDPVGGDEGGRALAEHYRAAGVKDVTLKIYDGARHELFNETNRDEVVEDLLAWLDDVGPGDAED